MVKAYVVTVLESDGACGDPECCGTPSYTCRIVKCFGTKTKAEAYKKTLEYPWDHEIHEVEVE
jgi:hypothetical protein